MWKENALKIWTFLKSTSRFSALTEMILKNEKKERKRNGKNSKLRKIEYLKQKNLNQAKIFVSLYILCRNF